MAATIPPGRPALSRAPRRPSVPSVGAAAGLSPQHRRLLWLLGVASFFEGYDFSAVTVALPQLRDTFGLSQSTASLWVAILYLGAAPALWLSRYADRAGRRR